MSSHRSLLRQRKLTGFYLQPGNKTTLAAGCWCPGKDELATLRQAIIADSQPLRKVISRPAFVKLFGEPQKPKEEGVRSSLWGHGEELKNAPKIEGVKKDHPEIEFLK